MNDRRYYSARTGKGEREKPDLPMLCRLLRADYKRLVQDGYFDQAFGYYDGGNYVEGTLGADIGAAMFRRLSKSNLWPIEKRSQTYSEEDLFDVMEFLHDCAAKRIVIQEPFSGVLLPLVTMDSEAGRADFRSAMNAILRDYRNGYQVSEDGEILALGEEHMQPLLEQELPEYDPENVDSRVKAAVRKFRHHTPTLEDKQEAVRQLADVLEFLHPKLEGLLPSKEENELFMIANKFGIRHHRADQKTEYDKEIWLDWIFYCYLNTIHVSVNLLKRAEESSQ